MPFAERLVELMRASNAPDETRIVAHGDVARADGDGERRARGRARLARRDGHDGRGARARG